MTDEGDLWGGEGFDVEDDRRRRAAAWRYAGIDDQTALRWDKAGFSPHEAAAWRNAGWVDNEFFDVVQDAGWWRDLGCTPAEAGEWREHCDEDTWSERWIKAGFRTPAEADPWRTAGFPSKGQYPDLARRHRAAGHSPEDAVALVDAEWVAAGFASGEYRLWAMEGVDSTVEAREWSDYGFASDETRPCRNVAYWRREGHEPWGAADLIARRRSARGKYIDYGDISDVRAILTELHGGRYEDEDDEDAQTQ